MCEVFSITAASPKSSSWLFLPPSLLMHLRGRAVDVQMSISCTSLFFFVKLSSCLFLSLRGVRVCVRVCAWVLNYAPPSSLHHVIFCQAALWTDTLHPLCFGDSLDTVCQSADGLTEQRLEGQGVYPPFNPGAPAGLPSTLKSSFRLCSHIVIYICECTEMNHCAYSFRLLP